MELNRSRMNLDNKDRYYAVSNMWQSIDNATAYCSYLPYADDELRNELEDMIESFQKRVQRLLNKHCA